MPDAFADASQLIARLWRAMDLRRDGDVLALLTGDCRWQRDGGWQIGKPAIRTSLERRPADLFVRHILSNVVVEDHGEAIDCAYYLAVYGGVGAADDRPRLPEPPAAMADMTTRCVRADGALRIAEIGMAVTFYRPPA